MDRKWSKSKENDADRELLPFYYEQIRRPGRFEFDPR